MEIIFKNLTNPEFYEHLFETYTYAFVIFFGVILGAKIIEVYVLKVFEKFAAKTETDIDDFLLSLIRKIGWPLYLVLALYFAIKSVPTIPESTTQAFAYLAIVVAAWYVFKISGSAVDFSLEKYAKSTKKDDLAGVKAFSFLVKFVVWSFVLVFILSNLGYNLTSIITGLGVGGIAVGLALQNVLGDFFSGIIILFDRPFEIGDFIKVNELSGTVKSIGVKTTRITLLDGQELVVTNKDLTESRIHNFKKLKKRRHAFFLGVTYDTPFKKLQKIPTLIEKAFKKIDDVELDRAHLIELADSSKKFEVVYYINSQDYKYFRDQHEKILLKIIESFEKEKIEFAFPTRTLHIEK